MCSLPHTLSRDNTESTIRDYVPLVNLIGIYFQIRDDYMNLQNNEVRFISVASYQSCLPSFSTLRIKVSRKTFQRGSFPFP